MSGPNPYVYYIKKLQNEEAVCLCRLATQRGRDSWEACHQLVSGKSGFGHQQNGV